MHTLLLGGRKVIVVALPWVNSFKKSFTASIMLMWQQNFPIALSTFLVYGQSPRSVCSEPFRLNFPSLPPNYPSTSSSLKDRSPSAVYTIYLRLRLLSRGGRILSRLLRGSCYFRVKSCSVKFFEPMRSRQCWKRPVGQLQILACLSLPSSSNVNIMRSGLHGNMGLN